MTLRKRLISLSLSLILTLTVLNNSAFSLNFDLNQDRNVVVQSQYLDFLSVITSGTTSDLIAMDQQAVRLSFGNDSMMKNRLTLSFYGDKDHPQFNKFSVFGQKIEMSYDAFLTIWIMPDGTTYFRPASLGSVSINGDALKFGSVYNATTGQMNQEGDKAFGYGGQSMELPRVIGVQGQVGSIVGDQMNGLVKDMKLSVPSTLQSGSNSYATALLLPYTGALVEENTEVNLRGLDFQQLDKRLVYRKADMYLRRGGIISSLGADNSIATDYRVTTPDVTVISQGGSFRVEAAQNGTKIDVLYGKVRLYMPGNTVNTNLFLTDGQSLFVGSGQVVTSTNATLADKKTLEVIRMFDQRIQEISQGTAAKDFNWGGKYNPNQPRNQKDDMLRQAIMRFVNEVRPLLQ